MPNWIPIAEADVLNALQAPELDALRTAVLGDTQGDPINPAIALVVPRIRGYVASRPGNKLDQDDTLIPPELFQDGVWLVIQALKVRLGDATKLTDSQTALIKRAEDDLQKVALGTLRISIPQNPQTTSSIQSGGGAEVVSTRTRLFGDMSGYTSPTPSNTLDGLGITDGVSKNDHWLNPDWLVSFSWLKLTDKPTTVATAGLTDGVSTAGSYSDPSWLTLSISKITGLAAALTAATAAAIAGAPVQSVAGRTGNVTLAVGDVSGALSSSTAASTYAPLASPALTGVPVAPTAAVDTNTTQLATTAYVVGQGYLKSATAASTYLSQATAASTYAPLASPALTGIPVAPTAAVDTSTTQVATTAYVINQGYLKSATASSTYAPLASPALTGTPTAPTPTGGDNSTKIATTAFVMALSFVPISGGTMTGNLLFTDNTYSIGASSGTRVKDIHQTGTHSLWNGTSTTQRAALQSSGDGILALLNNATTGFARLAFGPATSSNPAIKRASGTKLSVRLGDDTADADFTAAAITGSKDATISGITVGVGPGATAGSTVCGQNAGKNNTASGSVTAMGYNAGFSNTTGSNNNSFGFNAGYSNSTGSGTNCFGYGAGYSSTAGGIDAFGHQALYACTTGGGCAFGYYALLNLTTGANNAAFGQAALKTIVTGSGNTAAGISAGGGNSADFSNCTFVGYLAGYNLTGGSGNTMCLGYNAQPSTATVANEVTLGNSSVATLRCQVTTITSLSDRRDKSRITGMSGGLAFVRDLKPVRFVWNARDGSKVGQEDTGFIAQDLDRVEKKHQRIPGLVYRVNKNRLEAGYSKLLPVIVSAIQELDAEVKSLRRQLARN